MVEIVWKGGAEQDLRQIFAGFEEGRPGAGEEFTRMLDSSLQNLRSFPEEFWFDLNFCRWR